MSETVAELLNDIREIGGLLESDIAICANVSVATVAAWTSESSKPQSGAQQALPGLRYAIVSLSEFYRPTEVRAWLTSTNDLLGGQRAIDLIHDGRIGDVAAAIKRLSALAYI